MANKHRKAENLRLYRVWQAAKKRCNNLNDPSFHRYGGRGIMVCDRWSSFSNFIDDMGGTYKSGLTLERVDNNKDYSPENCKWATRKEQARNIGRQILLTFRGETKPMSMWAEQVGISYTVLEARIKRLNWTVAEALTTPVRHFKV